MSQFERKTFGYQNPKEFGKKQNGSRRMGQAVRQLSVTTLIIVLNILVEAINLLTAASLWTGTGRASYLPENLLSRESVE